MPDAYAYQREGTQWLQSHPCGLLGDEPGLGKTRQLLEAASGARTLVVAPAVLAGVWRDEAERWAPDLDLTIASYTGLMRRVANKDGVKLKTTRALKAEYRDEWDVVIFDEAHHLKGRTADQAKTALKLRSQYRWLATGTPIPNWADDLFMVAQALHPGDRRYTNYWKWVEQWFPVWEQWGGKKVGKKIRKGRTWEEFQEFNLGGVYLARTWDDVGMQLPELTQQTIEVPMVPAQRRAYEEMKKDYLADLGDGNHVVSWSSGSREANLVKMATALELVGGRGSGKLDMATELLRDWRGTPTIVACHLRATAELVLERCRKLNLDALSATGSQAPSARFDVARRFQAGEGDVLVVTIEAISEGLTITRANRMLFVEESYRPSRNLQALRRMWRLGQDRPCLVVRLLTEDSVDVRRDRLLRGKTDQQAKALPRGEFARAL